MAKAEMVGSYKGLPLTASPLEEVLTVVEEELRVCGTIVAAGNLDQGTKMHNTSTLLPGVACKDSKLIGRSVHNLTKLRK